MQTKNKRDDMIQGRAKYPSPWGPCPNDNDAIVFVVEWPEKLVFSLKDRIRCLGHLKVVVFRKRDLLNDRGKHQPKQKRGNLAWKQRDKHGFKNRYRVLICITNNLLFLVNVQ